MLILLPSCVYFIFASLYYTFDKYNLFPKYKINSNIDYNISEILTRVINTQLIQLFLAYVTDSNERGELSLITIPKIFLAMIVMDTYQYFIHYYLHQNKYLYKNIHSIHHKISQPYSFMALYNSYIESIILDVGSALFTELICGLTKYEAILFFSIATMKTVSDHSSYMLPYDPFTYFPNNAKYHEIHHDYKGFNKNFQQPFFTFWDSYFKTKKIC